MRHKRPFRHWLMDEWVKAARRGFFSRLAVSWSRRRSTVASGLRGQFLRSQGRVDSSAGGGNEPSDASPEISCQRG